MNATIDELYMGIAKRMVDAIGEEWTEAVIEFQYFGNAGEYTGRYLSGSKKEENFKVGFKTYKAFKSIYAITTQDDNNKWNRAKFTLNPAR